MKFLNWSTQSVSFIFNWKLTIFAVLLFPFLVMLGFWQIDRGQEKQDIMTRWQQQQASAPISFSSASSVSIENMGYQRVTLDGRFNTDKYWLKENQIVDGELGYNVIMMFEESSGKVVAVDRGWILGSADRNYNPVINTPSDAISITGTLIVPSDSKLIRESEVSAKTWPHKILEIDLGNMAKQIEIPLYNRLLKLDADSNGALIVAWKPANMSPAKHYGYAVQWFVLAAALIILYGSASLKINKRME